MQRSPQHQRTPPRVTARASSRSPYGRGPHLDCFLTVRYNAQATRAARLLTPRRSGHGSKAVSVSSGRALRSPATLTRRPNACRTPSEHRPIGWRCPVGGDVDMHSVLLTLRLTYGDEDEAQAVLIGDGPTSQKGLPGRDSSLAGWPVTLDQNLACACGSAQSTVTLRTIEVICLRSGRGTPGATSFHGPARGVLAPVEG